MALIHAIENTNILVLSNNTEEIGLNIEYPIFDPTLDTDLLVDILIEFKDTVSALENVEILKDGVSLGIFSFTVNTNQIWLSELTSIAREELHLQVSQEYTFKFDNEKLIEFKIITGLVADFISADDIVNIGLPDELTILAESVIQTQDENAVSALRHAIDNTDVTVDGNNTNIISFNVEYPSFGTKLSEYLMVDYLISFKNTVPLGTDISIRKNGILYKDLKLEKNTKHIWFSDLIEETRRDLKSMITEEWEFAFVYDHTINVKVITAELQDFNFANVAVNQLSYGMFELADSKTIEQLPITLADLKFIVSYNNYTNEIESAFLDLQNNQSVEIDYITDDSGDESKEYIRIRHEDSSFNVNIDLIMTLEGMRNYLELLRNMSRQLV